MSGLPGAVAVTRLTAPAWPRLLFQEDPDQQPRHVHPHQPGPERGHVQPPHFVVPDAAAQRLHGDRAQPQHRGELHARERATPGHPQAAAELSIKQREQHAEHQREHQRLHHRRPHHLLHLIRRLGRRIPLHPRGKDLAPHHPIGQERPDTRDRARQDPVHAQPPKRVCDYFRFPGTPSSVIARRSSTSSSSFPLRSPFSITNCRTVTFFSTASFASFAAAAYPILGASAVTSAGLRSSQCSHMARSASIPSTQRSANTREALVRMIIVNSRLCARTGIMTLSSSCPASAAVATVTSFPLAWKRTMFTIAAIDGLPFPGMLLQPGCPSRSPLSSSPPRRPDASTPPAV